MRRHLLSALLLLPFVGPAQDEALFDDTPSGAEEPAPPSAAPFAEWDGVTQIFPVRAEDSSHAESAEAAESVSHAESAENAEFLVLVGEYALPDSAPEGLSGIARTSNPGHPCFIDPDPFGRAGGPGPRFDLCAPDSYVLCEDSGAWLDFAEIGIDRTSGAITSAVFRVRSRAYFYFGEPRETADFEAIAYAPSRHDCTHYQLYVSDEAHPHIWQDRLDPCTTGVVASPSPIRRLDLPDVLRGHRRNKGVEAMCLSPDDTALWLANEDALPEDGPVATTEHGALVRLVRTDALQGVAKVRPEANVPTQWWYYPLDPATGTSLPHLPDPFNGLAELCALPDGRLLALERSFGFRTRGEEDLRGSLVTISIYLVDPLGSVPADPSHAEFVSHAENAEFAGFGSHAENAEAAEFESHAENAGFESHAENAEAAEPRSGEADPLREGAPGEAGWGSTPCGTGRRWGSVADGGWRGACGARSTPPGASRHPPLGGGRAMRRAPAPRAAPLPAPSRWGASHAPDARAARGASAGPLREGAAERSKAGGVLRAAQGTASVAHDAPVLPPAAGAAPPLSEEGATASPVLAKTLLWRGLTGRANYEGMTLGPELADGTRALILVSDGDVTRKGAYAFPWSKRLLSFRLRVPPPPSPSPSSPPSTLSTPSTSSTP